MSKCSHCVGTGIVNPTGGFGINPGNRMVTCPSCGGTGTTDDRTEAERIDPAEHVHDDDPRYDGFRIRDYWILTAIGPDNQEAPLWVSEPHARIFHLAVGVSMASDERRLRHLRQYAAWIAEGNPGMGLRIRHFVPEGEPETFGGE